jgi:hypothetical protein
MSPTQFEADLRRAARNRIANGRLPRHVPERSWGGNGTGRICALCDEPITPDEIEIELESWIDGEGLRTFQFHGACHLMWERCARDGESRNDGSREQRAEIRIER